jgi:hypothetical protein
MPNFSNSQKAHRQKPPSHEKEDAVFAMSAGAATGAIAGSVLTTIAAGAVASAAVAPVVCSMIGAMLGFSIWMAKRQNS